MNKEKRVHPSRERNLVLDVSLRVDLLRGDWVQYGAVGDPSSILNEHNVTYPTQRVGGRLPEEDEDLGGVPYPKLHPLDVISGVLHERAVESSRVQHEEYLCLIVCVGPFPGGGTDSL